ncbi:hypothetical protein GGQ91_003288 [Methylobacterium fujisawaense]|uniref:Tip attachment protein J domain-containing protein n=1 Tax=Methylobacterium fujisawaense TaxID=107400 RepID=A0ABR6DCT3_9HYPH|nr:hypothetical protein [Methylobacterium fujisawaense]MBA9063887.1 hypothetical protein [Methylobacterium fujisawaense]
MPAAIGAALIGELALGATAELVVGYAVVTVGTVALQYGVQALLGSDKRADHQVTVRQAVAPRRRVLGQAKLGGVIFALETLKFNDTNTVLYRGAVHCVGPVQILQYWFGDVKTGLGAGSGGFVPDSVYQGKVVIEGHAGTEDQPASAALLKLPYWTDAMRLKGLCYSVVVATPLKKGSQIFPEGAPDVRLLVAGAPSYDPRTGGYAYTDNAALLLLDYLMHDSGYGLARDEIDLPSFIALADVCDEPVALVVPDPNGATTEPRYRSWGSYDYTEPRSDVLGRLLAACDGEIYEDADGRVAVRGGRWQPPTVTITERMILGWDQLEEGDEAYNTFTRIKHTYTDPWHDYQPTEGDPWDDRAAQAVQGVIETERSFIRAPSHSQSRRLAKIAMAKGNPRFRLSGLRLSPAGLPAYGAPTVRLVLPSFGIDTTFAVMRGTLAMAGNALTGVKLDLVALDAAAYAWAPAEEGARPPLPDTAT